MPAQPVGELNAHGYEQIPMQKLDDERAVIERTVQTPHTVDRLAAAGIE